LAVEASEKSADDGESPIFTAIKTEDVADEVVV
jgi:hypothetical protein